VECPLQADDESYRLTSWHGDMGGLGEGRETEWDELMAICRAQAAGTSEAAGLPFRITLPHIEGFRAWHQGNFTKAVERLHPVRHIAHAFGGSHAQRVIIDWTLTDAAIRSGMPDVAEALAAERLAIKPNGHINRTLMLRARQIRQSSLEAAA